MSWTASLAVALLSFAQNPPTFRSKTFVNDGHRMTYEYAGQGQPVVLLSGGPGLAPGYLMPIADQVRMRAKAVLFHQRGTGQSKISGSYNQHSLNHHTAVADLEALRRQLGVPKLILLGHSWGGMLAQAYAAEHPKKASLLILVSSGGPDMSFTSYFSDSIDMRLRPEDEEEVKRALAIEDFEESRSQLQLAWLPGYFYAHDKGVEYRDSFHGKLDHVWGISAPLTWGFDVCKAVGRYKGRVELIQGRQDPMDAATAFQIKQFLPQTRMRWIDRCGHFPWVEQPAEFSRHLNIALEGSLRIKNGASRKRSAPSRAEAA